MRNNLKQFIVVPLSMLLVLVSAVACAHEASSEQDHISVVGVGEVEQEPDQATLRISISAKQPTLIATKKLADERYRGVLKVIEDAGIETKGVKATRVSAQPQYEWRNSKQIYTGELVSRSLNIIINDLDKVSPLMQALVENGVSTIDGMETGFKDRKSLQQQALAAAADDAKSKAKFLAERLGRNLGSAYIISEHNSNAPQMVRRESMMMKSDMAASVSAPPEMFGTQKVRATVNVSFNLL